MDSKIVGIAITADVEVLVNELSDKIKTLCLCNNMHK